MPGFLSTWAGVGLTPRRSARFRSFTFILVDRLPSLAVLVRDVTIICFSWSFRAYWRRPSTLLCRPIVDTLGGFMVRTKDEAERAEESIRIRVNAQQKANSCSGRGQGGARAIGLDANGGAQGSAEAGGEGIMKRRIMKRRPKSKSPETTPNKLKEVRAAGEIMTLDEAAELLLCHPSTIYRLLKAGQIPAFKLGSDGRFRRDALDQWIISGQLKVR